MISGRESLGGIGRPGTDVAVYGESLVLRGDCKFGSMGGDRLVGGFSRKLMLLFADDAMDADGEVGRRGMLVRICVGDREAGLISGWPKDVFRTKVGSTGGGGRKEKWSPDAAAERASKPRAWLSADWDRK